MSPSCIVYFFPTSFLAWCIILSVCWKFVDYEDLLLYSDSRILKWLLVTALLGLQMLFLSMDRTYEYGRIVTPSIRFYCIWLHQTWLKGQILLLTLKNCHIMETAKRQGMDLTEDRGQREFPWWWWEGDLGWQRFRE